MVLCLKKYRGDLEKVLSDICMNIATDSESCNMIYDFAKDRYDIPKGLMSDLICFRISMSEASEFVLFCLFDSIVKIKNINIKLNDFYSDQEIEKYLSSKYKVNKIKFPLRIKMIQVDNDQWIGSIDVKFLMKFRAAQLINYNVNAQRTMQKIIKGDNEIYKITLNQSAISSIKKNLKNESFIPNTITFNIPHDTDCNFYYDNDNCELVIKSVSHLDIIDGYHRYISCCKASDEDSNFNYRLELRIVNFSEDKAKNFIYQEDQKTKMRKIDSDSLNMNNAANIIATRLNENPRCNIKGLINRNDGLINLGEFAELIKFFYLKGGVKKEEENYLIMSLVKDLTECFNMITEFDIKYLNKKYSYKQLVIIIYMFYRYKDKDKSDMCEEIDRIVELQDQLDNRKFYSKVPRKSMINEIDKLIEVIIQNV